VGSESGNNHRRTIGSQLILVKLMATSYLAMTIGLNPNLFSLSLCLIGGRLVFICVVMIWVRRLVWRRWILMEDNPDLWRLVPLLP